MKLPLPLSDRLAWPRALASTQSQADLTVLVSHQVQAATPRFVVSPTLWAESVCPLSSQTARLTNARPARPVTGHRPLISKVMAGVKASNGNHGQSNMPGRGLGFEDGERAPQGGSAEAGAAATGMVDDGERAPPGGAAVAGAAEINEHDNGERAPPGCADEAGAASSGMLDDGERAPPGGSAEARAATMVVRDDGKRSAMSREQVAKSRSEANRVTGTVGTIVAS